MLIYYTEFMLFEIYFMLFRVMSSDSRLILLSACGERFPSPFYSQGDKPRKMSKALIVEPAGRPACGGSCGRRQASEQSSLDLNVRSVP